MGPSGVTRVRLTATHAGKRRKTDIQSTCVTRCPARPSTRRTHRPTSIRHFTSHQPATDPPGLAIQIIKSSHMLVSHAHSQSDDSGNEGASVFSSSSNSHGFVRFPRKDSNQLSSHFRWRDGLSILFLLYCLLTILIPGVTDTVQEVHHNHNQDASPEVADYSAACRNTSFFLGIVRSLSSSLSLSLTCILNTKLQYMLITVHTLMCLLTFP